MVTKSNLQGLSSLIPDCIVSPDFLSPIFFFFFQAEDGIRDLTVTGVQTCALPISLALLPPPSSRKHRVRFSWFERSTSFATRNRPPDWRLGHIPIAQSRPSPMRHRRSEERRVGKECRSRWWPYQ